ncbi:MAG: LytR/AlgR family response regulator transcription factor [Chitinophagaceae bacterium]
MNCIVIDSELQSAEIISGYITNTPFLRLLKNFTDPMEAILFIYQNKVDLVFLDVPIENQSAFEFAGTMHEKVLLIFLSTCPQYAVDAFEMNAVDFLNKPPTFTRFLKAVSKAIEIKSLKENNAQLSQIDLTDTSNENTIFLKSGAKIHKINLPDILFLEKDGNYFTIHLINNKKILLRTNFFEIFRFIPHNLFVRVHKSYIVNVRNIDSIEAQNVMIDKHVIPIGTSYREKFMGFMKLA